MYLLHLVGGHECKGPTLPKHFLPVSCISLSRPHLGVEVVVHIPGLQNGNETNTKGVFPTYESNQIKKNEWDWRLFESLSNQLHQQLGHVKNSLHDGHIPAEDSFVSQQLRERGGRGGEGEISR